MDQKVPLYHKYGISMLYFDQLSQIAKDLEQTRTLQATNKNAPNKLQSSCNETKWHSLKMLQAIVTCGTLYSTKTILLPMN